jgi:hypothetical protein
VIAIRTTFFNIKKLNVFPTEYIYNFCMILRINSNYYPMQYKPICLRKGGAVCFLYGRNWILKYYLVELQAKLDHNTVFKHPVYSSQTILFMSTMQLIYFLLLLLFTFTTRFGRIWPSSDVLLPKTVSLCGISHFFYNIWMRYVKVSKAVPVTGREGP